MTIHHQVAISATPEKVYAAISKPEDIGEWWDEQTVKETDQGLVLEHNPGEEHGIVKLKVVDSTPNKRVEWECISTHPESSPASVWTGTHFVFEITQQDTPATNALRACPNFDGQKLCTLNFYQSNYDENSRFLGFNNFAWGQILEGLKSVCESEVVIF